MAFTFGRIKNWSDGDTLTAPDLNAEFDNILSNATPASISALLGALATAGAANTHAVMNAAGTLPEYANPYFMGTFTRAMDAVTADVAYTGTGFKPSKLILITFLSTSFSIGFDNGTNHYLIYIYGTTPTYGTEAAQSSIALEDGSKTQAAIVKTFDANGFTLTWTRNNTPASANATVYYMALR
jgi:hypothetical protein